MHEVVLHPIGVLKTPFDGLAEVPIQPTSALSAPDTADVFQKHSTGLQDLAGFSHLILLYQLHRAENKQLQVTPVLDYITGGVFATRAPIRPNHPGLYVGVLKRFEGSTSHVDCLDLLDGTPLLDIKPYVPALDELQNVRCSWLEMLS